MSKSRNDPAKFDDVLITAVAEKSIKVRVGDLEEFVPKSQLLKGTTLGVEYKGDRVYEKGDEGALVIPRWLAIDRKFMDEDE